LVVGPGPAPAPAVLAPALTTGAAAPRVSPPLPPPSNEDAPGANAPRDSSPPAVSSSPLALAPATLGWSFAWDSSVHRTTVSGRVPSVHGNSKAHQKMDTLPSTIHTGAQTINLTATATATTTTTMPNPRTHLQCGILCLLVLGGLGVLGAVHASGVVQSWLRCTQVVSDIQGLCFQRGHPGNGR
jgi:hypothetical protein